LEAIKRLRKASVVIPALSLAMIGLNLTIQAALR
jgi:hypothetical protein